MRIGGTKSISGRIRGFSAGSPGTAHLFDADAARVYGRVNEAFDGHERVTRAREKVLPGENAQALLAYTL